jgi:nitrous oxidase accessory protein NosD
VVVGTEGQFSDNTTVFHNNFINNTIHAAFYGNSYTNVWDDGYPSGGNYWSNYKGTDSHNGLYQNITGIDGIGDTPYVIDANNQDHYPLMNRFVSKSLVYTSLWRVSAC